MNEDAQTVDTDRDAGAPKLAVGISSCLMGDRVRYDGGHKAHSYITNTLGEYFDFKRFCPELDVGLTIPRKPIRLSRESSGSIRCVAVDDPSVDFTAQLRNSARRQQQWLAQLCGYILKKDSPSCGMERVKVWEKDMPIRDGVGIYAEALMESVPYLPVEEEGRLGDSVIRENFIQRVFAMGRWHVLQHEGMTLAGLLDFHARHKLILMSHDQDGYRRLGKMVAASDKQNLERVQQQYLLEFMSVLKVKATRSNHVNTLQHIQGYLKDYLDAQDKQELVQILEKYRRGQLPLIVPISLLNHFFRKHPSEYIARSWYMNPYPEQLSL